VTTVGPGWVQLLSNIWNALPVLSTAVAFLGAPIFLLFFLLFAGTPFGRSIGGDGDMLLGLFNDVYEDYRLDQPWLLAKVLSQMFPEEFEPASSRERIILMRLIKHMFPEQLSSLTSWNELTIPSVLIHLAPKKFAQIDFKNLDQYVDKDANYGDMENVRHLFLRIVGFVQQNLPIVVNRLLTPQVEQEIKIFLKSKTEADRLKDNSKGLDLEWLFDRVVAKFRQSSGFNQEAEKPVIVESIDEYQNRPEWLYPKPSVTPPALTGTKCPWGPILCSMNRVSFQRKHGTEDESEKQPVFLQREPKIVPKWIRSIQRKPKSNTSSLEIQTANPNQRLPSYLRRLRINPLSRRSSHYIE
jgi:hypothetical protein